MRTLFSRLCRFKGKRNFAAKSKPVVHNDIVFEEDDVSLAENANLEQNAAIKSEFWDALSKHVNTSKTRRIWSQTSYNGQNIPGALYGVSPAGTYERERGEEFFDYRFCKMTHSVGEESELPVLRIPEFCFAGRSNVGKSSLINRLVGGPACVTSQMPGRTRRINIFSIRNEVSIVDLPGYGYAEGNANKIESWVELMKVYLTKRSNLNKCYHLIDCRFDLFESDRIFLDTMKSAGIALQFVLTKCDEIPHAELWKRLEKLYLDVQKYPMIAPLIVPTSSKTGHGIDELRAQTIISSGLLESRHFLSPEQKRVEIEEENKKDRVVWAKLEADQKHENAAIKKKIKRREAKIPAEAKKTPIIDANLIAKIKKEKVVLGLDDDSQNKF